MKNDLTKRLIKLDEKLIEYFGEPVFERMTDNVGALVLGILSANTNDKNRDRAYAQLIEHYNNHDVWEKVISEDLETLAKIIRPAGMSMIRADRIVKALNWLKNEFGEITAKPFITMPVEKAYALLQKIDGVGGKTAAVFLVFNRVDSVPFFPVDTHVHRVAKRIGIMEQKLSAARMQDKFSEYCPADRVISLHMNIILLGRNICHARKALCMECPISDICEKNGI